MSSLREQILERQRATGADAHHPLYSTGEHVITLRVEAAGGSLWIFPWHHFVFGFYQDEGDRERLVLTFVAHEVVMRGSNLGALVRQIAKQHLDKISAAPGKYLKSLGDGPFVDEIYVRPLADPVAAG